MTTGSTPGWRRLEVKASIATATTVALFFYTPAILGFKDFLTNPFHVDINTRLLLGALSFTLEQAVLSATLSLIIGMPAGLALALEGPRRSRPFRLLYTTAFMAPPMTVVMGFTALYGMNGIVSQILPPLQVLGEGFWAIIAAHVFYNAPLAALMGYSAFSSMPPGYWDLIKANGGLYNRYVIKRVILPQASRAAVYAWIIAFIYCFTSFAIPLTLGGPAYSTLEVLIYYNYTMLRWDVASSIAFLQFTLLLLFILTVGRAALPAAAPAGAPPSPPRAPYLLRAYLALLTLYIVSPLLGLLYKSLETTHGVGIENYLNLFSTSVKGSLGFTPARVLVNSGYFALSTLILVILIATISALSLGRIQEIVATALLAVSPVTMGFGLARTLLPIIPSWVAIVIAHSFAAYPLAANALRVGIKRVQRGYIEAAESMGETPLGTLIRVVIPLAMPSYATAASLAVAVSLGEFGATMVLRTKNTVTLGIVPYIYRSHRMFGEAYAAATLLLIATLIAVYLVDKVGERIWARK
ncbi:MAG: ABC transporter permease subunit [Desulfurococcales archaeon]|nr:ABC transporter permease subunit [Desulfurococcales archaeon]